MKRRVIQFYRWSCLDIIPELKKVKSQGFNTILISPIQTGKYEAHDDAWYCLYQPYDFKVGNAIGSKEDLIKLCNEANKLGLDISVDLVFNHMAGRNDGATIPHELVSNELKINKYFWKSNEGIYDWNNRWEVTNKSMSGIPGLNWNNHDLQDILINYLQELSDIGVKACRLDALKNIATPEEGCNFLQRVIGKFRNKIWFFGEVIFSPVEIIDMYSEYVDVLTDSIGSNRDRLVTFVDSHDLEHEFGVTKNMKPELINAEYYLLTEKYIKTMYYVREFDNKSWKSDIVRIANSR